LGFFYSWGEMPSQCYDLFLRETTFDPVKTWHTNPSQSSQFHLVLGQKARDPFHELTSALGSGDGIISSDGGLCQVEQVLLNWPSGCLDKLGWMHRACSTT